MARGPLLLDEQIRRNKRATVRLFVVMFLILWGMALSIGIILGYPPILTAGFALVFGLVYLASASSFSVDAILRAARAKPADPKIRAEKLLLYKVEELSLAAGLPMPKVYVTPSQDINAFATGRKPEEGVIAVTKGAMKRLDAEELEGVLAHEMSHILNQDIKIQTYTIALIGIIAMIGEMLWWGFIFGGRGRGGGNDRMDPRIMIVLFIVAIVFIMLAPLFARMASMAISRKREYLADASGAHMTRNPEALARALEKIGGEEPKESHRSDRTVASLYFANPFKRVRKESVWATHPPIQERVKRLRGQA
ncbi:MAG: M48 family metalloprotease [Thermoplasmatota archaeon]